MRLPKRPHIPPDDHRQTTDQRSDAQADFPGHVLDAPPRQESPLTACQDTSGDQPHADHREVHTSQSRTSAVRNSGSTRNAILTAAPSQVPVAPVPRGPVGPPVRQAFQFNVYQAIVIEHASNGSPPVLMLGCDEVGIYHPKATEPRRRSSFDPL